MSRIRNWLITANSFDDWPAIHWSYSKSTQTTLRTEKVTYSLAESFSGCSSNSIAAVFAKTIEFALAWDIWSLLNTTYSIRQKAEKKIRSQYAPLISANLKSRIAYHSTGRVLFEDPARSTHPLNALFSLGLPMGRVVQSLPKLRKIRNES